MFKKQVKYLLVIFFFSNSYLSAQSSFKPGYYLNTSDQKVNGLIKDQQWRNNPSNITFKVSEDAESKTISINEMNGFGLNNGATYLKKSFNLNVSPKRLNNLNFSKDPVFERKTALLKRLVAGNVNLFLYEDLGIKEFFYTKNALELEPLVYVEYLLAGNLAKNEKYKQQLLNALQDCNKLDQADFVRLSYKQNALVKLVNNYNQCIDPNYVVNGQNSSKTEFKLNVFAGANLSSVTVKNSVSASRNADLGTQISPRVGAELEALLPFNNKSWSLFAGLVYNGDFEATIIEELPSVNTPEQEVVFSYSTLNIPFGARYYINTSDNSQLGLEAGIFLDLTSKVSIEREITPNDFESSSGAPAIPFIGVGYYHNNLFVRANIDIGKDPFGSTSLFYTSDVTSVNLVLGYRFNLSKK